MAADETTRFVETVIGVRRSRQESFPADLFLGEQGWDILLELFVADAKGERLTARQLLDRVGGPFSAGERWIRFMNDRGLTIGDGHGRLDDVVTATPEGLGSVEAWAAGGIGTIRRLMSPTADRQRGRS